MARGRKSKAVPFNAADVANIARSNPYLASLIEDAKLRATVRQAADHMVNHGIGRLPVVSRSEPHRVLGMVTRSDILSVYRRRMEEAQAESPTIRLRGLRWR